MVKVVQIHEFGAPEVLKYEDADIGEPGPGEIRIRQTAVGLNFNDTRVRAGEGSFPPDQLPIILGREAAGVIESVGPDVTEFSIGQRVAYGFGGFGGYVEARLVPAAKVVALPDEIDDMKAAAIMVKGMCAQYLLHRSYQVQPGDVILVHAAAGGVGMLMCQWAKLLGADVIGTVSSDEKAKLALASGCDHVIVNNRENFPDRVREITNGQGVHAVYDSIGKKTFEGSIDSLRVRGHFVAFGDASGRVECIDPHLLMNKGSLHYTRTSLRHYIGTREDLLETANALFDVVGSGKLRVDINQTYPLRETAAAHRDLDNGVTTGSTVLLP